MGFPIEVWKFRSNDPLYSRFDDALKDDFEILTRWSRSSQRGHVVTQLRQLVADCSSTGRAREF